MDVRRSALLALAATTLLAVAGPQPARAAEEAPSTCPWNTRFLISPGVNMTPQDFTFTQSGTLGPCSGGDGSERSGRFTVTKGTGHGSCPSAQAAGPFTVAWQGGGTSKGTVEAVTVAAVAYVTGRIDEGLFAGTPFQSVAVLNASGPLNCGTGGVTAAETYGAVVFGAA